MYIEEFHIHAVCVRSARRQFRKIYSGYIILNTKYLTRTIYAIKVKTNKQF